MISWLVRHPVAANVLMWLVLIGGYFASQDFRRTLLPDTELASVTITVSVPGASPKAIEQGVLLPLERSILDLPELKRVVSTATQSVGVVNATLQFGVDTDEVISQLKLRIARVRSQMLPNIEEPIIESLKLPQIATYVVIASPTIDKPTLRALADQVRRDLLRHVPQVELILMTPEQTLVTVDPSALDRFNVSFAQVVSAVKSSSIGLSTGVIRTEGGSIALSTRGSDDSIASLEKIIVSTDSMGGRITLGELASIQIEDENPFFRSEFDGNPAVFLQVATGDQENITDVSQRVHEYVQRPGIYIPDSVTLNVWQDNARYFNERVELLTTNAWQGFALVLLLLMIFMRADLGFWVAWGIPVSYCGAMVVMAMLGVSLNMVSLFGFILVLGIVVDDAIIVGENIFTEQQRQLNPFHAAIDGTLGVMKPVILSVVTTVLMFMPLLMLPGVEGQLVRDVPLVVISVLLFSLFECLCMLPSHLAHSHSMHANSAIKNTLLKPLHRMQQCAHHWLRSCATYYSRTLLKAARFRYAVISLFFAMIPMMASLVISGKIDVRLVSQIDSELLRIEATFNKSLDQAAVSEGIKTIQAMVENKRAALQLEWGEDQIQHISTNWGMKNGTFDEHAGTWFVELVDFDRLKADPEKIAKAIEAQARSIPGLETFNAGAWLIAPGPDLFYDLRGSDEKNLEIAVQAVQRELEQLDGVYNVRSSLSSTQMALDIRVKPEASDFGLSAEDVARQIQAVFHGVEIRHASRGDEYRKLVLELPPDYRSSVWSLESLKITVPDGTLVPLTSVADIIPMQTANKIVREAGERVIRISAYLEAEKNNAALLKRTIVETILEPITQEWAVSWELSGAQKSMNELLAQAGRWFAIALIGMMLLLVILFRSYTQPFLVLIVIPWGLIGALLGHWIVGLPCTMWSIMGMIAVSGVVVNDNLVLIDCINQNDRQSTVESRVKAVLSGGVLRFRAIIMTTITTVAGLIPIMFETSVQAQFLIPMAVSLAFGVGFSTFVTLYMMPCLLLILYDFERVFWRRKSSSVIDIDATQRLYINQKDA